MERDDEDGAGWNGSGPLGATVPAETLTAWTEAWARAGAPVESLLAPPLSAASIRAQLEAVPGDPDRVTPWFGWANGPAPGTRWAAAPFSYRLLSLPEALDARAAAWAQRTAHLAAVVDEMAHDDWVEGWLPLMQAADGRSIGINLVTGVIWRGEPARATAEPYRFYRLEPSLPALLEHTDFLDWGAYSWDQGWTVDINLLPGDLVASGLVGDPIV